MSLSENLNNIKSKIYELDLTMLPEKTLDNIEFAIRKVVAENIEGDFLEAGVLRGGAVIFAYYILKELGSNKKVFAADSFEGLPKPNVEKYPQDLGDPHWRLPELRASLESVIDNFKLFGDIDKNVIFLRGWFRDTLTTPEIKKLSVLRLDGDMYESTWTTLEPLYPKLSSGGVCIIDDFGHVRAKQAVLDYREKFKITDEIKIIDETPGAYPSAYWIKS